MPRVKGEFRQKNAGRAQLVFIQEDSADPIAFNEVKSLRLMRANDKKFINSQGCWIDQPDDLALTKTVSNNCVTFELPPALVNNMRADTYAITLIQNDGSTVGTRLRIENVLAEKLADTQNFRQQSSQSASASLAETPSAQTEAIQEKTTPPSTQQTAKKSKLPLIIGLIIAALIAAALAFFLLKDSNPSTNNSAKDTQTEQSQPAKAPEDKTATPQNSDQETNKTEPVKEDSASPTEKPNQAEQSQPTTVPESTTEQTPTNQTETEPVKQVPPPVTEPLKQTSREKVRVFFSNKDRTPSAAMDLAKDLDIQSQDDKEALFRLHYYAANNDEASAFIPYAKALDPSQPTVGTVKKDPVEAKSFYGKAGDQASIQAMEQYLKDAAEKGDKQAKFWLSQLK